jgi:uncharacterized protein YgiM (DUF1202 family)
MKDRSRKVMNFWKQSSVSTKVILIILALLIIAIIIMVLISMGIIPLGRESSAGITPSPQVEPENQATALATEVIPGTPENTPPPSMVPMVTATVDTAVHTGPGNDFEIIARLTAGVSVEVSGISKDGQWWQIIIPNEADLKGWVSNQDVIAENVENVVVIEPTEAPAAISTQRPDTGGIATANTNVNVRGGPGLEYEIVGLLGLGEQAEILGISNNLNWWLITLPEGEGQTGWVFEELVTTENTDNVPTVDNDGNPIGGDIRIPTPAPGEASVTAQANINIRSGPGTDFEIIGLMIQGQSAQPIGKTADASWYAINIPSAENGRGWVTSLFLSTENVEDVPVLE